MVAPELLTGCTPTAASQLQSQRKEQIKILILQESDSRKDVLSRMSLRSSIECRCWGNTSGPSLICPVGWASQTVTRFKVFYITTEASPVIPLPHVFQHVGYFMLPGAMNNVTDLAWCHCRETFGSKVPDTLQSSQLHGFFCLPHTAPGKWWNPFFSPFSKICFRIFCFLEALLQIRWKIHLLR